MFNYEAILIYILFWILTVINIVSTYPGALDDIIGSEKKRFSGWFLFIFSLLTINIALLLFFYKKPKKKVMISKKFERMLYLTDFIFFLFGYWALIFITLSGYHSVVEQIISVILIISTYLCIRFYFVILHHPKNRKNFYFGTVLVIIFIQLFFGLIYYLIYESDQSAYQFLATDIANRKASFAEEAIKLKSNLQKQLIACRIVKSLFKSKYTKISRQIGLNEIGYIIDGEKKPLLSTLRFGIDTDVGPIYDYSYKIDLDFVSFTRKISQSNELSTPKGIFKNLVRDIHINSARKEIIRFLGTSEHRIKVEIMDLKSRLKRIDYEIKVLNYIDFILYSFNTSSLLSHGIIVPNKIVTKTLTLIQVIVTLIVLLGFVNSYNSRSRKKCGNIPNAR